MLRTVIVQICCVTCFYNIARFVNEMSVKNYKKYCLFPKKIFTLSKINSE